MIAKRWRGWQWAILALFLLAVAVRLPKLGDIQHVFMTHPIQLAWGSVID